jgi:Holliday junction resolvasome RuvABC endonuclease subunit
VDLSVSPNAHEGEIWSAFRVALARLLSKYHGRICVIAFERPVLYEQWDTIRIAFGQAAFVELAARAADIAVTMVSPSTLKKELTGSGKAPKSVVQEHVVRLTGDLFMERGGTTKEERKRRDKLRGDEADARAVGIVVTRKYEPDELRVGRFVERYK